MALQTAQSSHRVGSSCCSYHQQTCARCAAAVVSASTCAVEADAFIIQLDWIIKSIQSCDLTKILCLRGASHPSIHLCYRRYPFIIPTRSYHNCLSGLHEPALCPHTSSLHFTMTSHSVSSSTNKDGAAQPMVTSAVDRRFSTAKTTSDKGTDARSSGC